MSHIWDIISAFLCLFLIKCHIARGLITITILMIITMNMEIWNRYCNVPCMLMLRLCSVADNFAVLCSLWSSCMKLCMTCGLNCKFGCFGDSEYTLIQWRKPIVCNHVKVSFGCCMCDMVVKELSKKYETLYAKERWAFTFHFPKFQGYFCSLNVTCKCFVSACRCLARKLIAKAYIFSCFYCRMKSINDHC